MSYQRILTIQDISCVGQCSMTVALPILSACGHEVCILPSAVLSTHTGGFHKPAVVDLTDSMPQIWQHWQREGIRFDMIYTGYLGSVRAIEHVSRILEQMLVPGGRVIVDPAMADHGKLYKGFDGAYAEAMKDLCKKADVILPNITEAAMMTGTEYRENCGESDVMTMLKLLEGGDVVLTGVGFAPGKSGVAIRRGTSVSCYHHDRIDRSYHGTGDIFAASFVGALSSGKPIERAAQIAADYTFRCIQATYHDPAHWYGVKFEQALPDLIEMLKHE